MPARSVFHQLVSPQAKGLFRAAIGQSGHLPAVPREVAARTGQLLAERLGCWQGGEWQVGPDGGWQDVGREAGRV